MSIEILGKLILEIILLVLEIKFGKSVCGSVVMIKSKVDSYGFGL